MGFDLAPLRGTLEEIREAQGLREQLLSSVDRWLALLNIESHFYTLYSAAAKLVGLDPELLEWPRLPTTDESRLEYVNTMREVAPLARAAMNQITEALWWLDHEACDLWELCVAADKHRAPEPGHIKLGRDWGMVDVRLPDLEVVNAWFGNMRRLEWIGRIVKLSIDVATENLIVRRMRDLNGWAWELFVGDKPVSGDIIQFER